MKPELQELIHTAELKVEPEAAFWAGLMFGIIGVLAVYLNPNHLTPSALLFDENHSKSERQVLDHAYQKSLLYERRKLAWQGCAVGSALLAVVYIMFF